MIIYVFVTQIRLSYLLYHFPYRIIAFNNRYCISNLSQISNVAANLNLTDHVSMKTGISNVQFIFKDIKITPSYLNYLLSCGNKIVSM